MLEVDYSSSQKYKKISVESFILIDYCPKIYTYMALIHPKQQIYGLDFFFPFLKIFHFVLLLLNELKKRLCEFAEHLDLVED